VGSGDNNPQFEQSVATFVDGHLIAGAHAPLKGNCWTSSASKSSKGRKPFISATTQSPGVLNITSRDPGDHLEGYVRGLYNIDFQRSQLEAAVGGPLTDTLRLRVAGSATRGQGWLLDTGPATSVSHAFTIMRGEPLGMQPSDRLTAKFKAEVTRDRPDWRHRL